MSLSVTVREIVRATLSQSRERGVHLVSTSFALSPLYSPPGATSCVSGTTQAIAVRKVVGMEGHESVSVALQTLLGLAIQFRPP